MNRRYGYSGIVYFSNSHCKMLWSHTSLKVFSKNPISSDQIGLKEKPNQSISKTSAPPK